MSGRWRIRGWTLPVAAGLAVIVATVSCSRDEVVLDEVRRLAGLCEVWGLLKYYHPQASTRDDWDDVLVSFVPRIEAAETQEAFNGEIVALVDEAGAMQETTRLALDPSFRWVDDETVFLPATSAKLRAVLAGYRVVPSHYVAPAWANGPADFSMDQGRSDAPPFPDEPTRLLALFRFWNMVQYFFPDRDVMDRTWLDALPVLIPKFVEAEDATEYHLAVAEMTASIDDAHAAVGSTVLNDFIGRRRVPLDLRLVEGRTTITRVFPRLFDRAMDLRPGDVVTQIDGVPPETRRATLRDLVNASNPASLERNTHEWLQRTNAARLPLTVEGASGRTSTWDVNTVALDAPWRDILSTNPEASAVLPGNIGYVQLGWLHVEDVAGVMERMRDTRGIVFDARIYPHRTLYALTNYLNPAPRPFAKFRAPDFARPGFFAWTPVRLTGPDSPNAWPGAPPATYRYTGRVVVVVNEDTLSQGEFTVMALKTVAHAVVVGSQTAGADGDVVRIRLPGGIATGFSGLGVFYPDGTPTQRVGIVPDVVVEPTLRGLREGRDEMLEAALATLH